MNFLKNVFATIVGLFLFVLLSFFFLIGLGALVSSGNDEVKVKDNSVIKLDLAIFNLDLTASVNRRKKYLVRFKN